MGLDVLIEATAIARARRPGTAPGHRRRRPAARGADRAGRPSRARRSRSGWRAAYRTSSCPPITRPPDLFVCRPRRWRGSAWLRWRPWPAAPPCSPRPTRHARNPRALCGFAFFSGTPRPPRWRADWGRAAGRRPNSLSAGRAARQIACAQYDWKNAVNELEDLLPGAIAPRLRMNSATPILELRPIRDEQDWRELAPTLARVGGGRSSRQRVFHTCDLVPPVLGQSCWPARRNGPPGASPPPRVTAAWPGFAFCGEDHRRRSVARTHPLLRRRAASRLRRRAPPRRLSTQPATLTSALGRLEWTA
jgi:hypothetical protein